MVTTSTETMTVTIRKWCSRTRVAKYPMGSDDSGGSQRCADDRPPDVEPEVEGAQVEPPATESEEHRLGEGQHAAVSVHHGEGQGEQAPDQDFGDEDALVVGQRPGQAGEGHAQDEKSRGGPAPRPWRR